MRFFLIFLIVSCIRCEELKGTEELKGIKSEIDVGDRKVEYVYQIPTSSAKPKGVVFLAHGCQHSSTDFWPKSDTCSSCIGLPVERAIVTEGNSIN